MRKRNRARYKGCPLCDTRRKWSDRERARLEMYEKERAERLRARAWVDP